MNVKQRRARIDENGRIVIPASFRRHELIAERREAAKRE